MNLGIDFTSGTRVDLQSDQAIKTEQVSKQFKDMGLDPSQVTTSGTGNKMATVQFKDALNKSEIQKLNLTLVNHWVMIQT